MKTKLLIFILFAVLCVSACKKETEIKGDVFVVTQGAGSYKLGLVEVSAIPRKVYESYVLEKKSIIEEAKQKYAAGSAKCSAPMGDLEGLDIEQLQNIAKVRRACANDFQSAEENLENIFVNMPKINVTATTDADGKFTLKIPKQGDYILTAKAERKVSDTTEKYYWAVPVTADGQPKPFMLSNNNQTKLGNLENLSINTQP